MDTLTNLRTFLVAARSDGFSEAARQLHVVPSVVAKRIAQLEREMQTRLFVRTTRTVQLTDAGRRLQAQASLAVSALDDVIRDVRRDEGRLEGHIRLMVPTSFMLSRLGPLIDEFLHQHAGITLELALMDRSTNPQEAGVDIVISGRLASYEGVLDIPLCPVQPGLFAAPAYLERRGIPAHPRELIEHSCLVFRPYGGVWIFQSPRGQLHVEVSARLTADENHTLLRAAKSGHGIVLLGQYMAQEELAAGRLVPVLPEFPLQESWFKAYVPRRSQRLARVRALLDWLAARLDPEGQVQVQTPPQGMSALV